MPPGLQLAVSGQGSTAVCWRLTPRLPGLRGLLQWLPTAQWQKQKQEVLLTAGKAYLGAGCAQYAYHIEQVVVECQVKGACIPVQCGMLDRPGSVVAYTALGRHTFYGVQTLPEHTCLLTTCLKNSRCPWLRFVAFLEGSSAVCSGRQHAKEPQSAAKRVKHLQWLSAQQPDCIAQHAAALHGEHGGWLLSSAACRPIPLLLQGGGRGKGLLHQKPPGWLAG